MHAYIAISDDMLTLPEQDLKKSYADGMRKMYVSVVEKARMLQLDWDEMETSDKFNQALKIFLSAPGPIPASVLYPKSAAVHPPLWLTKLRRTSTTMGPIEAISDSLMDYKNTLILSWADK